MSFYTQLPTYQVETSSEFQIFPTKQKAEDIVEEVEEKSEGKMSKGEFLDSIGIGDRPGSQLATTKWEEYCAGI